MTPAEDEFDCLRCGACCAPPDARTAYVDLTALDIRRLPTAYAHGATPAPRRRLATKGTSTNGTTCCALRGRIGRHVTCAIYEDRPAACRTFRPGSRVCRIVRELRFGPTSS